MKDEPFTPFSGNCECQAAGNPHPMGCVGCMHYVGRISPNNPLVLMLYDEYGNPKPWKKLQQEAVEKQTLLTGSKKAAALALGIGRSTLYRRKRQKAAGKL